MCQSIAQGGQRCSGHASEAFQKAEASLHHGRDMAAAGDTTVNVEALREQWDKKAVEFASTPEGSQYFRTLLGSSAASIAVPSDAASIIDRGALLARENRERANAYRASQGKPPLRTPLPETVQEQQLRLQGEADAQRAAKAHAADPLGLRAQAAQEAASRTPRDLTTPVSYEDSAYRVHVAQAEAQRARQAELEEEKRAYQARRNAMHPDSLALEDATISVREGHMTTTIPYQKMSAPGSAFATVTLAKKAYFRKLDVARMQAALPPQVGVAWGRKDSEGHFEKLPVPYVDYQPHEDPVVTQYWYGQLLNEGKKLAKTGNASRGPGQPKVDVKAFSHLYALRNLPRLVRGN